MEQPTLEESVELLKSVSELDVLDPDAPLLQTEVDSLHMVEWLYALQERHPALDVDESLLDDIDDTVSFRAVHERLVRAQIVTVAPLADASGRTAP